MSILQAPVMWGQYLFYIIKFSTSENKQTHARGRRNLQNEGLGRPERWYLCCWCTQAGAWGMMMNQDSNSASTHQLWKQYEHWECGCPFNLFQFWPRVDFFLQDLWWQIPDLQQKNASSCLELERVTIISLRFHFSCSCPPQKSQEGDDYCIACANGVKE